MEHSLDFYNAVVVPYINFFVFLAAFVLFFRKPLVRLAQKRRTDYLDAAKEAQAAMAKSQEVYTEVKARFDALDSELLTFKKQSEVAAQADAHRQIEDAKKLADQIKEETKRYAIDVVENAKAELRKEVVKAAIEMTVEKIKKDLNSDARSKILEAKIQETSRLSI